MNRFYTSCAFLRVSLAEKTEAFFPVVSRPYLRSLLSTGSEFQYPDVSVVNVVFGGILTNASTFPIGAFQSAGYKGRKYCTESLQAHIEVNV